MEKRKEEAGGGGGEEKKKSCFVLNKDRKNLASAIKSP